MHTRSGKPIAAKTAVIQGRTLKYNEQDKPGRIDEDIRNAEAWANWTPEHIINRSVTFDPDVEGSWIYWTDVIMVRDE